MLIGNATLCYEFLLCWFTVYVKTGAACVCYPVCAHCVWVGLGDRVKNAPCLLRANNAPSHLMSDWFCSKNMPPSLCHKEVTYLSWSKIRGRYK